jgi:hypothetical protein
MSVMRTGAVNGGVPTAKRLKSMNGSKVSRYRLTIYYSIIIALGGLGVWLGSVAEDSTELRRWLGLASLLVAAVLLFAIYPREFRISKYEQELQWRRIRSQGRWRFILKEVLLSQLVLLPFLFGSLYNLFSLGEWSPLPWWWWLLAAIGAVASFKWSLDWWRLQERKH